MAAAASENYPTASSRTDRLQRAPSPNSSTHYLAHRTMATTKTARCHPPNSRTENTPCGGCRCPLQFRSSTIGSTLSRRPHTTKLLKTGRHHLSTTVQFWLGNGSCKPRRVEKYAIDKARCTRCVLLFKASKQVDEQTSQCQHYLCFALLTNFLQVNLCSTSLTWLLLKVGIVFRKLATAAICFIEPLIL